MLSLTPKTNRSAVSGHVLTTAICILAIMATIAGVTIQSISARYKTAYRTAAWHESLVVAEAGVDMTLAQVVGLLPDVQLNAQSGLSFATSTFSTALITGLKLEAGGLNLANGLTLSITPDPLTHGGEGASTSSATVSIDVLPLDQLLNGNIITGALAFLTSGSSMPAINILRIRSTGTVYLPGSSRVADVSKLDVELHHAALVLDPQGNKVTRPYISRQIEVLLKPVFPFQNGLASDGFFHNSDPTSVFDSFSSASPLTSTNNLYDASKRRMNIQVSSNSSDVQLLGNVFGNVLTYNGPIIKDARITGSVNNSHFTALPAVSAPSWSGTGSSTTLTGSNALVGGALLTPKQYKLSNASGTVHVTSGNVLSIVGGLFGGVPVVSTLTSSEADIYISGNFNGKLIVDSGVNVKIYVKGNMTMGANALQNLTNVAANVQIYGVPTTSGTNTMTIDTTGGPVAAIYAPAHAVVLNGNGNFSGAITAGSLNITGGADVHFDEALALQTGPVLGYQLVSWKELNVP